MVKTGQDNLVYYIAETAYGTGNTPDDGTWSPFLEVQSVSGRALKQEKKSIYRHGQRKRSGVVEGKIDPEDLVIELFMVDDATALNFYDVFLEASFEDAYDEASLTSYTLFIPDNITPASSTDFEYYYGCVLKDVELVISEGDPNIILTATFDVQTYTFTTTEAHAPVGATYTAHPSGLTYLLWSDVALAKANFAVNGSVTSIQELNFTVNQNYSKIWTINGQKYATKNVVEGYEVDGSFTYLYENLTEFHDEYNDLDGDMTVTITRTTSPIVITIDDMTIDTLSVDSAPNELQTVDGDFTATLLDFA